MFEVNKNRFLALIGFVLLAFAAANTQTPSTATVRVSVQVSNTQNAPMKGLRITTKTEGSTETTDDAGKAIITYRQRPGPVELIIVSPPGYDFISPWQRSISVPPDFWSLIIGKRGARDMLENPRVVRALTERANDLQSRKGVDEPPPSARSKQQVIQKVASDLELNPDELESKINSQASGTGTDPYTAGLVALFQHNYKDAAVQLESVTLPGTSLSAAERERAASANFFLGQARFELGDFRAAAAAYHRAGEYRSDDPLALNNEGLSWMKAGEYSRAEPLYKRGLEVMEAAGMTDSVEFSTTLNNLSALYALRGELNSADEGFRRALEIRRKRLPASDLRMATSLNNIAVIEITQGKCAAAEPLLEEALRIQQQATPQDFDLASRYANDQQAPPFSQRTLVTAGSIPASATPGVATTLTNQAMIAACNKQYQNALTLLRAVEELQRSGPASNDLGNTQRNIGQVYVAQQKWEDAEREYRSAVESERRSLGNDHPVVAQTLQELAEVLVRMNKNVAALDALQTALDIQIARFGEASQPAKAVRERMKSIGSR